MSFIFKSTGVAIKFLEKILKSDISTRNLENIPEGPVLFVANHFTRSETFILPYILHKFADRHLRSLAGKTIFESPLGNYLESLGTISTGDPQRNNKILRDLITGRNDWLIYPEGTMVKNKYITNNKLFHLNTPKHKRNIYTGSAVLALQTELLKKEFLIAHEEKDHKKLADLRSELLLNPNDLPTPHNLNIVPVSINYYPIRPGHSKLEKLILKLITKPSERILEEIEIETNLLQNSEIIIYFSKPINVYEYIKTKRRFAYKIPVISNNTKKNLLINFFRTRLTHLFMQQVYNNCYINIDHIFANILYFYPFKKISIQHLKDLIYIISREIRKLEKYNLHKSVDSKLIEIFKYDHGPFLNCIYKLAIKQQILTFAENNELLINHQKLRHEEYHQMRINNTLRIFINEMRKFKDVQSIFKKNIFLPNIVIQNKTIKTIIRSDIKEFHEDYEKYYDKNETKPRENGAPFFLEAKHSDIGIILSHGYKSSPEEVRLLAKFFHKQGYNVYAPRLKGHGTGPENLKDIQWQDWCDSFHKGYAVLQNRCSKIIAAGFSTGGLLALLFASKHPRKLSAVISINSAIKLNDIRVNLVPTVHFWNELLTKLKASKGKMEYVVDIPENPHINYKKNYLNGVYELSQLMTETKKNLAHITCPTLIIQGKHDPVVDPKSGKIIYKEIASKNKHLILPEIHKHVFITNPENIEIFKEMNKFISKNVA
jgi:esterase/lipase/1-acyl-sn-glycerol-3-phosphate acyltransferase